MKWVSLLACFLLLLETAAAAPTAQRRRRTAGLPGYYQAFKSKQDEGRFSKVVLRNGLTLLVEERSIRPLAAVATYLRAGGATAREWAAKAVGCTDLESRIRLLGGFLEASAGRDYTVVTSVVPADKALSAMEAHAALMSPLEMASDADCGHDVKGADTVLPPDSPKAALRRLTGTGEESAASARPEAAALSAFAAANAVPARTLLAVSGDVRREKIFELTVKLYSRLKHGSTAASAAVAPAPAETSFQYLHLRRDQASPELLFGYRIAAPDASRRLELQALALILGGGRGSLTQRHLVRAGLALDASAQLVVSQDHGLFQIRVAPVPEKVDAAEVGVLSLVELLGDEDLMAGELQRAKALMIRKHYVDLQTLQSRVFTLARRQAQGRFGDLDARVGEIAALTGKRLAKTARRTFSDSRLSLVESFPSSGELRNFTAQGLLETLRLLVPADSVRLRKEVGAFQAALRSRAAPPADFNPVFLDYDLKRTSILRGPEIYLEEEHSAPIVHLGLFYPGGRIDETAENAGVTELTLRSLLRNLEARQGAGFWFDLERRGAALSSVNEPEFFGFQVSTLSPDLPDLLRLLSEWLRRPEIEAEGFDQEKAALEAAAAQAEENLAERAMRELSSSLFEDHPFSRGRFGAPSAALDLASVREWAKSEIEGYHPVILIRGDVQGTSFLPDLIPILSDSKYRRKRRVEKQAKEGPRHGVLFAHPAGGAFFLGCPGPKRGSRDDWLLDALESLVFFLGDRIPSDDRSLRSYRRPRMFHRSLDNGGAVFLQARAVEGDLEKAARQAQIDLSRIQSAPIRDVDLRGALVTAITRFYSRQERKEEYLLYLARNLLGGEKPGFRLEYLTTIKGIGADDLRGLAGRYFQPPPARPDAETAQISSGRASP